MNKKYRNSMKWMFTGENLIELLNLKPETFFLSVLTKKKATRHRSLPLSLSLSLSTHTYPQNKTKRKQVSKKATEFKMVIILCVKYKKVIHLKIIGIHNCYMLDKLQLKLL